MEYKGKRGIGSKTKHTTAANESDRHNLMKSKSDSSDQDMADDGEMLYNKQIYQPRGQTSPNEDNAGASGSESEIGRDKLAKQRSADDTYSYSNATQTRVSNIPLDKAKKAYSTVDTSKQEGLNHTQAASTNYRGHSSSNSNKSEEGMCGCG